MSASPLVKILIAFALTLASVVRAEQPPAESARGTFFAIDEDIQFHVYCVGAAATQRPIVFTDAGVGGNHFDWHQLQQLLKNDMRVCAWDRAGYGFSSRGPRPRTSTAIATEFNHLLDVMGIDTPIVLVGHSFGGLNVLQFSHLWPKRVAAIVLIDAVHFRQFDVFKENGIEVPTASSRRFRLPSRSELIRGLPAELHDIAYAAGKTEAARGAMYNELRNMPTSAEQANPINLPQVPLRVITHDAQAWEESPLTRRMESLWLELQRDLSRLVDDGQLVVAPSSGHEIHIDNPGFVYQQIMDVVLGLDSADGN